MGRESERFFGLMNSIIDTRLLVGCTYGLIHLALCANAAYADRRKMTEQNGKNMEHVSKQVHEPDIRY